MEFRTVRSAWRRARPAPEQPDQSESDNHSSVLAIRRYLAEHFSRAVYYWHYDFSPSLVERESPDLVLQLIGERSLSNGPPENPPALQAEAPVREVVVRTRPVGDGGVSQTGLSANRSPRGPTTPRAVLKGGHRARVWEKNHYSFAPAVQKLTS